MRNFNLFFINKSVMKSVRFFLMMFFCITVVFTLTTGCEDENSEDAKLFDAQEALNDGDWETAKEILLTLAQNEEVLQYLSNAYAGSVGINTFDLLTTIDTLDDENNSGSIDMIGTLIGDGEDFLLCEALTVKLNTINNAIKNMNAIMQLTGTELNNDQKVQLGLASITRTVIIMAKLICEETGGIEIKMTEEWIKNNRAHFLPISPESWDSSEILDSEEAIIPYSTMLMEDINNVANAVAAITGDNDIKDDFDVFKAEIDNGSGDGTAGDNEITLDELNHYLDEM